MHVVQPAGIDDEVKLIGPITLEAIADSRGPGGIATPDEVSGALAELDVFAQAEDTVLSIPRIVQAG